MNALPRLYRRPEFAKPEWPDGFPLATSELMAERLRWRERAENYLLKHRPDLRSGPTAA
jgi:hypothetical protein